MKNPLLGSLRNTLFITIGVFIVAALCVNSFLTDPTYSIPEEEAVHFLNTDNPRAAEKCLLVLVKKDSNNIDAHYQYIQAHYAIPKREKVGKNDYIERDDESIRNYYYDKISSADSAQRDIGNYGWGLCWSIEKDYEEALESFDSVHNRRLKYLNNSIGFALRETGSLNKADSFFKKEIENNGNVASAWSNRISLLLQQKRMDELKLLLSNSSSQQYFSNYQKRKLYFHLGEIGLYWKSAFMQLAETTNSPGFTGAVIILICWFLFLRRIDVFETEKWAYMLLTCALGMLASFGTYFLTDVINDQLHFNLTGELLNDFFYSVFGIGAVEELVKFLPFFIMLVFTRQVNEPIDYIIYASLSALGFAFIENLLYFDEGSLYLMHGRALTAVISHMFDASVIGYGLMICRYKSKRNIVFGFLVCFLLAAFTHGFYDFWLINEKASRFSIITFVFLIISFGCYNVFINNALNNSVFFDKKKQVDADRIGKLLFYSLSSVLLFEYLIISYRFGPTAGKIVLMKSLLSGAYLIFILSISLSAYDIKKGVWAPLLGWLDKKSK